MARTRAKKGAGAGGIGSKMAAATAKVPVKAARASAGPAIKLSAGPAAKSPKFQKTMEKLQQSATKVRTHEPASKKTADAQAASVPPSNEKLAGAQANKASAMKEAETGKPDSNSFLAMLRAEIAKAMPKNLEEADEFMDGGKKEELKSSATGKVNQEKDDATAGMKSASQEPPNTAAVPGKDVTPMPIEPAPGAPPALGTKGAMPDPKSPQDVSLEDSKKNADKMLADEDITETQLKKANDPRFTGVITAKEAVQKHADSAPLKYRADESKTIATAQAKAVADERQSLAGFSGARTAGTNKVRSKQAEAKAKDEARRREVTTNIEKIFNETKTTVDAKLSSLETEVGTMFDRGSEAALNRMKRFTEARLDEYKDERYSGLNKWKWVRDKLVGLPDEANVFYEQGRKVFIADMDALVVRVANLVEQRLAEAKAEIARGQKRISDYVNSLPKDLQAVGRAAEQEMASRFDEMRAGVDAKKNELASNLAQKYKEATDKADAALKEMKDANKGLVTGLIEKLGEIIRILRDFKNKIVSMLKKGADTISLIVSDPIGFLGNLLKAIKKGISQFVDNIWTHLKAGFMSWMFGTLAKAGVTLPTDFSLGSILRLVLQLLGLTWQRIRPKVVKAIGARNVAILEKAVEMIRILFEGGPAALWEHMKEYLSNLKETVIDAARDWVISTIIKAAITKVATMFNPVGAIIQAIITIYNTVMFLIERINQILAMVEAVINSVHSIATGAIDAAANWIEQAMARTIPLIISFLARLLGLGGISDKIKSIITKIQARVDAAVDKVIAKVLKGFKSAAGAVANWWRKRLPFRAKDGQAHTLFFEGEEASAVLMVASEKFAVSGKAASDPELKKLLQELNDARAAKDDQRIFNAMKPIADRLAAIMGPGDYATETKPIVLPYPKKHADYQPVYLGPVSSDPLTQADLKAAYESAPNATKYEDVKDTDGYKKLISKLAKGDRKKTFIVRKYVPDNAARLPADDTKLGISTNWKITSGRKCLLLPDKTAGGGVINSALKKYGYRSRSAKLDGDHIIEMQLGGPNILENLWPLDQSINRSSGSTIASMDLDVEKDKKTVKMKMSDLKTEAKKRAVWLKIK